MNHPYGVRAWSSWGVHPAATQVLLPGRKPHHEGGRTTLTRRERRPLGAELPSVGTSGEPLTAIAVRTTHYQEDSQRWVGLRGQHVRSPIRRAKKGGRASREMNRWIRSVWMATQSGSRRHKTAGAPQLEKPLRIAGNPDSLVGVREQLAQSPFHFSFGALVFLGFAAQIRSALYSHRFAGRSDILQ